MLQLIIVLVPGLAIVVGVVMLVVGLRGRRVNDHPVCRKCRFDLFGNPEAKSCPECGRDLQHKRAVRVGVRRRRRGMIGAAALLLFFGVGGGGTMGYLANQDIDWQRHKPVWWLMREADGEPGAVYGQGPTAAKTDTTSDLALEELRRRQDAGELTKEQIFALVDRALAHQANEQRTWQPAWGNLIETARRDNLVTDEQWETYADQFLDGLLELEMRPKIQQGVETVGAKLYLSPGRTGDNGVLKFWMNVSDTELQVGPVVKKGRGLSWGALIDRDGRTSSTASFHFNEADWQAITPGKQPVVYAFDLAVFESAPSQLEGADVPLVKRRLEMKADVDIVAADQTTVTLNKDPAIGKQVEAAITLNRLRAWPMDDDKDGRTFNAQASFFIRPRPVDIAFEVFLRLGDEEIRYSSINASKSQESGYGLGWVKIPESFVGRKVDVILRPSTEVASKSVDCFEIWGEEIVFEDVILNSKGAKD